MRIFFKFSTDNDLASVGYTEGKTWQDIFDAIDEFGDPNEAVVVRFFKKVPVSFCMRRHCDKSGSWDIDDDSGIEVSINFFRWICSQMPALDDPEWVVSTRTKMQWASFLKDRVSDHAVSH